MDRDNWKNNQNNTIEIQSFKTKNFDLNDFSIFIPENMLGTKMSGVKIEPFYLLIIISVCSFIYIWLLRGKRGN
jgi:hypothetical protein